MQYPGEAGLVIHEVALDDSSVVVSGRGRPGAEVVLFACGERVSEAVVGPLGWWTLFAELDVARADALMVQCEGEASLVTVKTAERARTPEGAGPVRLDEAWLTLGERADAFLVPAGGGGAAAQRGWFDLFAGLDTIAA